MPYGHSLQVCDSNHEEICFYGSSCPICDLVKTHTSEIESMQSTIDSQSCAIDSLQNNVNSLQAELNDDLHQARMIYKASQEDK